MSYDTTIGYMHGERLIQLGLSSILMPPHMWE